jgi:hypothetical protein
MCINIISRFRKTKYNLLFQNNREVYSVLIPVLGYVTTIPLVFKADLISRSVIVKTAESFILKGCGSRLVSESMSVFGALISLSVLLQTYKKFMHA